MKIDKYITTFRLKFGCFPITQFCYWYITAPGCMAATLVSYYHNQALHAIREGGYCFHNSRAVKVLKSPGMNLK